MKKVIKTPGKNPDYIVGIGASAGGLIPINDFFESIPGNTGMAFVIIQHLSPDHKSLMGELLSKHTSMLVYEAEENMAVNRDCIYLIPNQHKMIIKKGRLKLLPKEANKKPNNAIDVFFESLGQDYGKKAIGIILSGTGSDGTIGINTIKKNGGIIIAQDPMTAEFDGMPNSAIASGHADMVLAPEMMPSEMMDLLNDSSVLKTIRENQHQEESIISNILTLVHSTSQHDFSNYKRPTLQRRLAKRMLGNNISDMQEYYKHLVSNPEEVKILSQEFLINVTKFFRDRDAFAVLESQVLPELFHEKNPGDLIKIWSVACSSGEEAYSLAMLFQEYMLAHNKSDITVKVFATDVDNEALETAASGVYPAAALKDLSQERKDRFFIQEGQNYRISAAIRKMVVFAHHDISRDAPYSKTDLISCRNMLIYMNPVLQNNVLQAFHFSLKEKGFLFLGPSENIGPLKDAFEETNRKWKIFKCVTKARILQRERFGKAINLDHNILHPLVKLRHRNALNHLPEVFCSILLEEDYAGIFIDSDLVVKQAIGKFKKFLSFPDTNFNFNLLKLVPTDLAMTLSLAVRNSIKENKSVSVRKVKVHQENIVRIINIIVKPFLSQQEYVQPFLFVVLQEEEERQSADREVLNLPNNEAAIARIDELEKELHYTKETLQALVEQIETANEELQSTNEEMSASHEELQSTNEELQSLNEELHTVNAEHQQKIKELNEANDDLNNYFNSSDVGQLFIDKRLLIRKFSPAVKKQINVKDIDVGRSIIDISNNFKSLDFINEIKNVMKSAERVDKEVTMNNERTFLMTINPYLRKGEEVNGVVITFTDITQLKSLNTFIEAIFNASCTGTAAMKAQRDANGKITGFYCTIVNAEAEKIIGAVVNERIDATFGSAQNFMPTLEEVVEQNKTVHVDFLREETQMWYQLIATKIDDGLLVTFTDITERKKSAEMLEKGYRDLQLISEQLKHFNQQLERSNFDLLQFASVASHDLKEPLRKIQVYGDMLQNRVKEKLNARENELLAKITKSSGRMKALIDDVLTFSKLSNNEVVYEKIDLDTLIKKILEDLEIAISEKNASVVAKDLPVIKGNPGQMNQVFQNLISNALKFNDSKNPTVIIREEPMSEQLANDLNIPATDYYCIVVEDNGIGFDNSHAEKIFGIFQRLNAAAQFDGTGIGLAICKKILENHKGFIKAESELTKGSKFFLVFPKTK